jgi:RNA polymerase sigma-70 factor (ECF subfamily)
MDQRPSGARLAAEWSAAVRAFYGRRCARAEDAEDLSQEALCAIITGAVRFRGECSEATWVYAVCRNILASWLRAREREARLAEAARAEALAGDRDAGGGLGQDSSGLAPAEREELGIALEAALASLRPAERRLYELYYPGGLRVKEISGILEKPEGTVKYQLALLRGRLRSLLGPG